MHLGTGKKVNSSNPQSRFNRFKKWLELTGSSPSQEMIDEIDELSVHGRIWALSPERQWYMGRRPKVFFFVIIGGVLILLAAVLAQPIPSATEAWWASCLVVVGVPTVVYALFPYWAARAAFKERRRTTAALSAEQTLKKMKDHVVGIPLNLLFEYNRRQLDAYQEKSRNQQRVAFRDAQIASLSGVVVLVAGAAVSLRESPGTEQYVVAGLSSLGATLSGYIAGTLLKTSREADRRETLYYQEPHMTGRLIAAERISKTLSPEQNAENAELLIRQILTWPLPSDRGAEKDKGK